MNTVTARIGGLTCRLVDDGAATPKLTVVLCHGYGAPGTDLVSLGSEALRNKPLWQGKVRFVFPEAPLSIDGAPGGGRAWWHLDWQLLEEAARDPAARARMQDETPDGLAGARKLLLAALDELARTSAGFVLGGFSQGAMLATDVALRLDDAPAALMIFSGTLLSRPDWERLAKKRAGLPVVVTHGTHDPLLPYAAAQQLAALLADAGLRVTQVPFDGPHTIDPSGFAAFLALVDGALAARG